MRICLISSEHSPWGGMGRSVRRLASLLAGHHEVTLMHSGGCPDDRPSLAGSGVREVFVEPSADLADVVFCSGDHRRSAAVLEAIEDAYGAEGPDWVEVCDYRAHGLIPLMAARTGHRLLRQARFAVRLASSAELLCLHDGTLHQPGMRLLSDLEREQLRLADRIVWPGGDVLGLYRRYYPLQLPEAVRIRLPLERPEAEPALAPRDPARPLRILYAGRLQRCKGALDLAEACLRLPAEEWELTIIGADTPTAPTGQSVRLTLDAMFAGDPRVSVEDPLPHEELQRRWPEHDLLVVPSTFEVWPNVALEAMRAGLPILATPVGGLAEIVEPGVTGWLADDIGTEAIQRALSGLLENPGELESVRAGGAVFERFLRLTDPDEILQGYEQLFESARPASPAKRSSEPLVTGVLPYHHASDFIEDAVDSLLGQTHSNLEVLIVNDGSFEDGDAVLSRLAEHPRVGVVTQLNGGESSARNLGARLARGEYVMMLDADNILEKEFVSRALEIFGCEPELAYVSCWLRLVAPDGSPVVSGPAGYAPLGNRVVRDDTDNWDGDTVALLPRRIFAELGYGFEPASGIQSDWELYRSLRADGRFGVVIQERLVRYRIREDSVMRAHGKEIHRQSWNEALDRRLLRATRWTAEA